MRALVTGGAGYIGAHMVHLLLSQGHEVAVLDNFSTGHREVVPADVTLIEQDLTDSASVAQIRRFNPDVIFHFAAKSLVSESMQMPWSYLSQNICMTMHAIEGLKSDGIMIYSSSCAVYGTPRTVPISEASACHPLSPYGRSKLYGESLLRAACQERGLRAICLRYFNVAGCGDAKLVENHDPETHLIPNLLKAAGQNRFSMYGTDHPTEDGTAVRDYIDVRDLTEAHLLGAERLSTEETGYFHAFNLGSGSGYSVKEVFHAAQRITGKMIEYDVHPARAGDPPCLVADYSSWQRYSGWKPSHTLEAMISSAWNGMHG